jgi:hypothetical protein
MNKTVVTRGIVLHSEHWSSIKSKAKQSKAKLTYYYHAKEHRPSFKSSSWKIHDFAKQIGIVNSSNKPSLPDTQHH